MLEFTVVINDYNLGSRATIAQLLSPDGERARVRGKQLMRALEDAEQRSSGRGFGGPLSEARGAA